MDRRKEGRTKQDEQRSNEPTDGWTDKQNEPTNGRTNRQTNKTDEHKNEQNYKLIVETIEYLF